MKIDFTGRGVDIDTEMREHTQAKLERLKKHLDDIRDVHVVLSVQKYRHKAEINLQAKRQTFHGQEETSEMMQSIDRVIEKIEKQARRSKAKRINRKRKINGNTDVEPVELGDTAADGEIRVIRSDNQVVKPMNLDEAVEEIQKFKQEFLIFQNSESQCMGVVYKRPDGHVGYIEPKL